MEKIRESKLKSQPNSSILSLSQLTRTKNSKKINFSCQGLGNTEFPNKLKKLEKLHEQDIIQLYSLIEKMNTEIQTLKAENQNLKLLLQDQKRKDKGQVSQIQFQSQALTSKLALIEKHSSKSIENQQEIELTIKKQTQTDKMENEQKILIQQNFTQSL